MTALRRPQLRKDFAGRSIAEGLPRAGVEEPLDPSDILSLDCPQVKTLGDELTDQAVGVLLESAFPRLVRPGEVDAQSQPVRQAGMVGEQGRLERSNSDTPAGLAGAHPPTTERERSPSTMGAKWLTCLVAGSLAMGAWGLLSTQSLSSPATMALGPKISSEDSSNLWDGNESLAEYARRSGIRDVAVELALDGNVKLMALLIPASKFWMGSPDAETSRRADEVRHQVLISKPFYMSKHLVTRRQFSAFAAESNYRTDPETSGWAYAWDGNGLRKVTGASWRNPGFIQTEEDPVVEVSYSDAAEFCRWLSRRSGRAVRLPTEAEWECARRAGKETLYPWGNDPNLGKGWSNAADITFTMMMSRLDPKWTTYSWDDGHVFTSPVAKFSPNAFGLHDVVGNVWQWCADWYGPYSVDVIGVDPRGPASGTLHVLRGGSWSDGPQNCRAAFRLQRPPYDRNIDIGFRVAVDMRR